MISSRARTLVALLALILPASFGCQGSKPAKGAAGSGGAGTGGGQSAGTGGEQTAGTGGTFVDAGLDGAPRATCNVAPTPLRTTGTTLALPIEVRHGGEPFVFGEPNATATGTVVPLNFRFYVSHVTLTRASGAPVPVDLVDAAGSPEPYGVHLYNAEDPTSETLRVLAPAGTYTGVSFMLGIDDACNSEAASAHSPPLEANSQMTWPHLAGYLFLRYEGRVEPSPDATATSVPAAIHMGGVPGAVFAPIVSAAGALTIGAQATSRALLMDMDAVFTGATSEVDPSTLSPLAAGFPEVGAGDRLRQHVARLPLFVLGP